MDVSLGPWTADKRVNASQGQALADAMGDEAWKTVTKAAGFTPKESPKDKPAETGIAISGVLTSVTKNGANTDVVAKFSVWVDGTFSNVAAIDGRASAQGSSTPEDALRAVTENRVNMVLLAISAGKVAKAH